MTENIRNESSNKPAVAEKKEDNISRAKDVAERLENANKQFADLLDRQESLAVEKTLGGESSVLPPEKKELSAKEYAAKVMNNDLE